MKIVRLEPEKILEAIRIASESFGTFHFTHLPERIRDGVDELAEDFRLYSFWESSDFCCCFSPKWAAEDASDRGMAVDSKDLAKRKKGFAKVCQIFGCSAKDEVVGIRPIL